MFFLFAFCSLSQLIVQKVPQHKLEERDANGQQLPLRTKIPGYYILFQIQISHFPLKPPFRANYNCSNCLFTPPCSFICLYLQISLIFLTHRVECWVRMLIIRGV